MQISEISINKLNNPTFGAKPIPKKMIQSMNKEIKSANKIGIFIHQSPDNDAIGSAKPMFNYLQKLGKDVVIFANKNELKGLDFDFKKYKIATEENTKNIDLALMLDCNKAKRLPVNFIKVFENVKKVIGLDHHDVTSTTNKTLRIDKSASSTCSLVYRFFERVGFKPKVEDMENLYSGFISDALKSKMIKIDNVNQKSVLVKTPKLNKDKRSKEILENLESGLPLQNREKILKKLDILSSLNEEEKKFQQRVFSDIKLSKNGKLAYVVIPPNDSQWRALGMDNTRTSAVMGNFRQTLIGNIEENNLIPNDMKPKLKKVKGAMVFYRTSDAPDSPYQMSITTKGRYAKKLRDFIKNNLDPEYIGDGHPHRQGGKVLSLKEEDIQQFINNFLIAAQKVN